MTDDRSRIPLLSLILGYGPALVMVAFGAAIWVVPPRATFLVLALGQVWAGAILLFLAGVRRGLSFFTEGGPRPIQVATSLWLFMVGLAALLMQPPTSFVIAGVGYVSVSLLDPRAARRGEAPAHFTALRPPQMALFVLGLASLAAWMLMRLP